MVRPTANLTGGSDHTGNGGMARTRKNITCSLKNSDPLPLCRPITALHDLPWVWLRTQQRYSTPTATCIQYNVINWPVVQRRFELLYSTKWLALAQKLLLTAVKTKNLKIAYYAPERTGPRHLREQGFKRNRAWPTSTTEVGSFLYA
jgi:hypothetical protein